MALDDVAVDDGCAALGTLHCLRCVVGRKQIGGGLLGSASSPTRPDPNDRAREILAERYARGELTTEEYRERVEQLR